MLRQILAVTVLGLLASCLGKEKRGPVSPDAVQKYSLTVSFGAGISGTPVAGRHEYSSGQVVQYNYSMQSGYRSGVVEISGQASSLSGSVLMGTNKEIFATAEAIPVVPPESAPVEESASSVFSAVDSLGAIAAYMENAAALERIYSSHSIDQAREISVAGYLKAYESASQTDFDRMEQFVGGQIFGISGQPSSMVRNLIPVRKQTAVIFVNGILSAMDAPSIVRQELGKLISEAGLSSKTDIYSFYNASGRYDPNKISRCIRRIIQLPSYKDWLGCGIMGDLAQSGRQIADILNKLPAGAESEALALAKIVKQERSWGRGVILIGHSQGTLMVQQALRELGLFDPCVSAISLGGPLGRASWTWPSTHVDGFVVSGERTKDVLLHLGMNDFQKVSTGLSRSFDQELSSLASATSGHGIFRQISYDFKLHSMVKSYVAEKDSREVLRGMIAKQSEAIAKNSDCSIPSGVHMYASSGQGVSLGPSDLWIVPPYKSGVDALVARIRTASGDNPVITDIARAPSGELWGISFTRLYQIDEETALAEEKGYFISMNPNALAFNHNGDLYVADGQGRVMGVNIKSLTSFWSGNLGQPFVSSGDLAFSPDGWPYIVVKDGSGKDVLAKFSLNSGNVETLIGEGIGFGNVFGLGFVGRELFGVTADSSSGTGQLIKIDLQTGKGTLVRKLSFNAFGASGNMQAER